MSNSRVEVMKHLESFAAEATPTLLKSEDEYWQPADFLPDFGSEEGFIEVRALQERSAALSDDLLVVLIGDMITEEALPTYSTWIGQVDGFDKSGEPRNAWGDWLRKWTGEENRHGDVLNKYLYLTGRVNMREIEVTIQNLLSDGGDVGTACDPYKAFAYTSFQELATNVSHRNVARLAREAGDEYLAKICNFVAGDETRHARAYKLFFAKCLEADPDAAVIAFYEMMKSKITMPAMYMRERGKKIGDTFKKFTDVAERTKVYTPFDYTTILDNLNDYWAIGTLKGLSPDAAKAQEYLCTLSDRYRKIAERMANRQTEVPNEDHRFAWLEGIQGGEPATP